MGGLWARAAKITFLIRNPRYKTGMKDIAPSGFTFPLCLNTGVRGQGPVDAEEQTSTVLAGDAGNPSLQESREVKTGQRSILRKVN